MGICSGRCTSDVRLDNKIAVITGCNTGIGKITVLDFCRRGCKVIMACRDLKKAEEAKEDIEKQLTKCDKVGSIVIKKLDLASLKSVRDCAEEILQQEPKIHLLINNAGVMMCPKMLTEDGFEMQFGTNHLGHFLLTLLLLPRMQESVPARIVNLSSIAHRPGRINFDDLNSEKEYSALKAYQQSKLANVLFTRELARRLKDSGVTVYSVHPGVIATELGRHLDDTLLPGSRWFFRNMGGFLLKTPEQGAQTTIYCAVDDKAGLETGLYYKDCHETEPSNRAKDDEVAKKLWEVSAKMVNYDLSTSRECW